MVWEFHFGQRICDKMWWYWEHLWEFYENMTIFHWEFDVNTLRTWWEHFGDIENPNLPHLPNPFLSTLIPPPWWVWVPICWFCKLSFLMDFCFVLVMHIFDWPITKTNTQTMDSLNIEDYVALPICLAIKVTRVRVLAKGYGKQCGVIGNSSRTHVNLRNTLGASLGSYGNRLGTCLEHV